MMRVIYWLRRRGWLMYGICLIRGHNWYELLSPPDDGLEYNTHLCTRCLSARTFRKD